MRNEVRTHNRAYFKQYFINFDIFYFIYSLIDKQILTINPRFNFKNSSPFLLYLLQMI